MRILLYFIIAFLNLGVLYAQTPAPDQYSRIVVRGVTAHLGTGEVLEDAAIAFDQGVLTYVGKNDTNKGFPGHQVINAEGKHVYPGFIAPNTRLGMIEIDAVRATADYQELGHLKPHIRSLIAYNADSDIIPTIRTNGILLTQATPVGGRISGQSSIMELDAWNWEDAAYKKDDGIHLNWINHYTNPGWWGEPSETKKNKNYEKEMVIIQEFFAEALAYSKKRVRKEKNLKFEAMKGLFNGNKTLYIHANFSKEIMESVLFAQKYGIAKIVIVGGRDSWIVADFLKENQVPVILRQLHNLPAYEDSAIDRVYTTAKLLEQKGVLFCLSMEGAWEQRNLPFQAGQAIAYGLDYEKGVKALTLNAAKILGIDSSVGSLEIGKDATFFISEGDAFDIRSCKVTEAFIRGKAIDLDNKQKALYRKYKAKYQVK